MNLRSVPDIWNGVFERFLELYEWPGRDEPSMVPFCRIPECHETVPEIAKEVDRVEEPIYDGGFLIISNDRKADRAPQSQREMALQGISLLSDEEEPESPATERRITRISHRSIRIFLMKIKELEHGNGLSEVKPSRIVLSPLRQREEEEKRGLDRGERGTFDLVKELPRSVCLFDEEVHRQYRVELLRGVQKTFPVYGK